MAAWKHVSTAALFQLQAIRFYFKFKPEGKYPQNVSPPVSNYLSFICFIEVALKVAVTGLNLLIPTAILSPKT